MKKILFAAFILAFVFSCSKKEKFTVIKGRLKNSQDTVVHLKKMEAQNFVQKASAKVGVNGEFTIKLKPTTPEFYILCSQENDLITLLINPDEQIEMNIDGENFSENYSLKGSKGSILIKNFNEYLTKSRRQIDSVAKIYQQNQYNPEINKIKKELDIKFAEIKRKQRKYTISFIEKNYNSLACVPALLQDLYPGEYILDPEKDEKYFNMVDTSLTRNHPNSPYLQDLRSLKQKLQEVKEKAKEKEDNLAIGKKAPNISLNSYTGAKTTLKSLRGKYVLVDFWASWSNPCLNQNKELMKFRNKYWYLGFEVFQVSLDTNKEAWIKSIKDNKLIWINVSDQKQWESKVVKDYNVKRLPCNFLLDKKGKIIAKNLTKEQLEKKLKELFKY